jgi:hypothetical protein
MPESRTESSAWSFTARTLTLTAPPRGVNFTALVRRFQTTCCSRSGSPSTGPTPGSTSLRTVNDFAATEACTASSAHPTISDRSSRRTFSRSRPDTMRFMSSRSSMSCACARALRAMVSSPRRVSASPTARASSSVDHPSTALSGVRSSCDSVARNSSFSRLTRPASARAARSAATSRALSTACAACAATPTASCCARAANAPGCACARISAPSATPSRETIGTAR